MQKHFGTAERNAAPLSGAKVTVYDYGTSNLSSLFDDAGAAQANPFYTDGLGMYAFSAADGAYDVNVSKDGFLIRYTKVTLAGGVADGSVTTAKFDPTAKAPNAGHADEADTAAFATEAGLADSIADGTVSTAKVVANAVTNAKLAQAPSLTVKANITGGTANEQDVTFAAFGAALTPYLPESLAMMNESATPTDTGRTGILLDAPLYGQISLRTGSTTQTKALGYFNWTSFTWTEVTISGPAAIQYATAVYVPGTDRIWAANSAGTTHVINPATGAATTATQTLFQFVYNPFNGKIYGYANGSATLVEIDPTTGTTSRSLVTAQPGFTAFTSIGCNAVTGDLYLYYTTSGGHQHVCAIVVGTFNSIAWDVDVGALGIAWAQRDRITCLPAAGTSGKLLICGFGSNSAVLVDINGGSPTAGTWTGRFSSGALAAYNPSTGYAYLSYLTNRFYAAKIDPTTKWFDSIAVMLLVSVTGSGQGQSSCWASDGHYVVQTNGGTYIRLYP